MLEERLSDARPGDEHSCPADGRRRPMQIEAFELSEEGEERDAVVVYAAVSGDVKRDERRLDGGEEREPSESCARAVEVQSQKGKISKVEEVERVEREG